jgi:hypothetical protein
MEEVSLSPQEKTTLFRTLNSLNLNDVGGGELIPETSLPKSLPLIAALPF